MMLQDQCDTRIGTAGRIARLAGGSTLIALEIFWRDPRWWDPILGLIVAPALTVVIALLWSRRHPSYLRATGPIGHLVNLAIFVPALVLPATAGAAFLFYGGSMVIAAATASGGCEVTAVSNLLLRRDDQVGCALFLPVDAAARAVGGARATTS